LGEEALASQGDLRQPRVWEVDLNLSQHCPHASTPHLSAMILAVLGEAACCRVEVAAIERFIELFGDAPIGLGNVQGSSPAAAWDSADSTLHTNRSAATIGYRKGTGSQSTGGGTGAHSSRVERIPTAPAGAERLILPPSPSMIFAATKAAEINHNGDNQNQ